MLITRRALISGTLGLVAAPYVWRRPAYAFFEAPERALCVLMDRSGSMFTGFSRIDGELVQHIQIQKRGTMEAIRALAGKLADAHVAISVMYFAGIDDQEVVVPWTFIQSPETALAVALYLEALPIKRGQGTYHSFAVYKGCALFQDELVAGTAVKVADISTDEVPFGDAENARDFASSHGIVINAIAVEDADVGIAKVEQATGVSSEPAQSIVGPIQDLLITRRPQGFVAKAATWSEYAPVLQRKIEIELGLS